MPNLTLCTGPECPACGCRDSQIVQPATGGRGVAVCGYCGRRFGYTVPEDATSAARDQAQAGRRQQRKRHGPG